MAKNVFRAMEIINVNNRVTLDSPFPEIEVVEEAPVVEEYTGPTADDLRKEAELFKTNWDKEKDDMIKAAESKVAQILRDAEQRAFEEVQQKTDEIQVLKKTSEDEAGRLVAEAEKSAAELTAKVEADLDSIRKKAEEEGYEAGLEKGYAEGQAEVERLVQQLHSIIDKTIEKRNEIIDESETQVINLVVMIAKKVVKVISENQKNVVVNNVIQALRKLKSRGEVLIKVNLADVELTSEHIKDFMRMVENIRSVTVVEDSTVDRGGCIIETDFGEIDARISSQLHEIEEKILDLVPIKTKGDN
ncbi:MAG: flagellar assembly protein FliH [Spirochaetes bacterium]|nr:MAG: flagellar assembly protein FliH [Spirochaetota bacterium]